MNIKVNSRASICLDGDVYIDPFKIRGNPKNAKVVLITHPHHWDHLSIDDIKKVANKDTFFIGPQDCIDVLVKAGFEIENQKNFWAVAGKSFTRGDETGYKVPTKDMWVQAFPAYNIDKPFHPYEKGWVGFIITIDGVRYAICGDTDVTPEAKKIKCDVLFVPIGGHYTMDALDAAGLANHIKPKIVVPIHYMFTAVTDPAATIGGKDAEKLFVDNLDKDIDVKIVLHEMEV